jgi:hypothetical protein
VESVQADQNATNAAKTCKAEQADANFASSHDSKSFADFYGASSNRNGKGQGNGDAFGKCVSSKAQASLRRLAVGGAWDATQASL